MSDGYPTIKPEEVHPTHDVREEGIVITDPYCQKCRLGAVHHGPELREPCAETPWRAPKAEPSLTVTTATLARALDPLLWSDNEMTAHIAASPLRVDYARERSLERAEQVMTELRKVEAEIKDFMPVLRVTQFELTPACIAGEIVTPPEWSA